MAQKPASHHGSQIFLMATILEELVLVQLKDPQASPELTLAWKPRLSLRFQ